jgi:signal transduction histidine kinase
MTRWVRTAGEHDYRGVQLLALLLVAVVVPSACVLWFMNEAVTSQADATRRTVVDAYRGQLRLVRGRLNAFWQSRAAELESDLTGNAAADFKRLVTSGLADAVVVLGPDGTPMYPSIAVRADVAPAAVSVSSDAARAAQVVVRNLVQARDTRGATETIIETFISGPAARGTDPDGRLIAADEHLLLINLLAHADPRRSVAVKRLTALLNDYSTLRLPSAQRLYLMEQVRSLEVQPSDARFPTLRAERLALAFLEAERPAQGGVALRPTMIRDLWQVSSPRGRVVALYQTGAVNRAMRALLDEQASPAVSFVAIQPGASTGDEAVAIGPAAPGWEVSFTTSDQSAGSGAARGRRNSYLSIALLAIGAIALAVATIGGAVRRQARLASLKTDLVSAVSHELKTPLASMRLLVDALLEDEPLEPAKTRDYLQLMAVENVRLSRLIESFLTFSRLERNRHQFTFQPTNPGDVVHDALVAMPERLRVDRAPSVEISPDLPAISADHDALVTAILNLLDNAYKYTPADARISVRTFREGDHVVFTVEDNGIGIPRREQKRIFRRFYRVDQRLARDTAGSGLGLSIVDAIVRAHGGAVRVRSRQEHGSTFAVYVPCAANTASL